MKTTVILACFMLNLGFGGLAGSQDLPPEILADQYLLEAAEAFEQGEPRRAIQAFEKIETLDTEPPGEFLFFYGKLLVEHGTAVDDLRKGEGLLKQFILNIEKDAEQYRPTLKLLSVAAKKVERQRRAERQRQAEQQRQAEEPWLKLRMVRVEGGTFRMGIDCTMKEDFECQDSAKPVHSVWVPSFELSKYEVTQEIWVAVMGENPSVFEGCPQCPVESVSWDDVQTFLEKLNTLTSEEYRLPTEAEWEYAARGGQQSRGYKYAGSNGPGPVAWYEENSGDKTHPVGQKQPNELGLYDMSGNVFEMVEDCWTRRYRRAPLDGSAWLSGDCDERVGRGGAWMSDRGYLLLPRRRHGTRDRRDNNRGFRVARTLTP